MEFINLTPHTVRIRKPSLLPHYDEGGWMEPAYYDIEVAPSGKIARVSTSEIIVSKIEGIPLVKRVFGRAEGIPEPVEGTIYIVSSIVLEAVERKDVVAPDTGATAIRDERGQIYAVTRLISK